MLTHFIGEDYKNNNLLCNSSLLSLYDEQGNINKPNTILFNSNNLGIKDQVRLVSLSVVFCWFDLMKVSTLAKDK